MAEPCVVYKPPHRMPASEAGLFRKVFLAGSIDMGKATDWQADITESICKEFSNVAVFNPRRDDWDSSWEQTIENAQFNEQVTWEMDYLDVADVIPMYFEPKGKAPITLLELGLHAHEGNVIICCPKGFWRRGNIEMVADRFNLTLVEDYDEFKECIFDAIEDVA